MSSSHLCLLTDCNNMHVLNYHMMTFLCSPCKINATLIINLINNKNRSFFNESVRCSDFALDPEALPTQTPRLLTQEITSYVTLIYDTISLGLKLYL